MSLIINPFAPFTPAPPKQEPARSEKRAEKKSKRTKAEPSRIWSPGADPLAMSLKSFATSHPEIWKTAQDLALYCADSLLLDPSHRVPIAIDMAGEKDNIYVYLRISLLHDLYGKGVLKILADDEYEVNFWSRVAPPKASLSSKNKTKRYITEILAKERNESLQIIRALLDVDDTDDVKVEAVERELNLMIEKYHEATDQPAADLLAWMGENSVRFIPPRGEIILTNAVTSREFKSEAIGARNLLLTTEFTHYVTETRNELMDKIGEFLVLEQLNTNYLYTVLQELASVGMSVIAKRSVQGDTIVGFKEEPEEYKVYLEANGAAHLPLLPYTCEFTVTKP